MARHLDVGNLFRVLNRTAHHNLNEYTNALSPTDDFHTDAKYSEGAKPIKDSLHGAASISAAATKVSVL